MAQRNAILVQSHPLKLGIFGPNCSSGRTYATIPERWDTTWENNVAIAQQADAAGIECMVPIARWKGYGGESNPNGTSWESITWACGLLAATRRINVFATVHVPLNHPVVAAKQMVTADHIGRGRFGVNVVCGWNEDEFQMFGVTKKEHEGRYEQGAEWWTIVKRIWDGEGPFDFEGNHYRLKGVEGSPLPYGGAAPLMMNAGSSPSGRAFAIRYSDMHFDGVQLPEQSIDRIAETKQLARDAGRAHRVVEVGAGLRVEVDAQLVGMVDVVAAHRPRVEGDRPHLRGPADDGDLGRADLVGVAAGRELDPRRLEVVRRALRHALLEERVAAAPVARGDDHAGVHALRPALERRRPPRERAHDPVRDREVVADDIELGHGRRALGGREDHAVGARHADLAASCFDSGGGGGHAPKSYAW